MGTYSSRLWKKIWSETKSVWTSYRWWLSIAGPLATVLVLVYRRGWGALLNAQDVLLNGIAGAAIAFVGTLIVSLVRSPKLLDEARREEILEREGSIAALNRQVLTLSKKPWDLAFETKVRELLDRATPAQVGVLKFLLHRGQMEQRNILPEGYAQNQITEALYACERDGYLNRHDFRPGNQTVVMASHFEIKEHLRPVLQDLLFPSAS